MMDSLDYRGLHLYVMLNDQKEIDALRPIMKM